MKTNLRIFAALLAVLLLLSMMLSCGQRGSGTQDTGTGDGTTRATGQQILDMLETASRYTKSVYEEDGNATGECGAFMQVSGLRYTVDTSIPSSVRFDEKGFFRSVDGARRVKHVQVQKKDGTYADIDPQATYSLASNSYLIKEGGDGINLFVGNELLLDDMMIDSQVLITYLRDALKGRLGEKYAATEGRIVIE